MKTLTEKYKGVLRGLYSREQFLRDVRQEQPRLVTQYNSYKDAVRILEQRGIITNPLNEEDLDKRIAKEESVDQLDTKTEKQNWKVGDNVAFIYDGNSKSGRITKVVKTDSGSLRYRIKDSRGTEYSIGNTEIANSPTLNETASPHQLDVVFGDTEDYIRAKQWFNEESDFYPSSEHDKFQTLSFEVADQQDADATERAIDQELQNHGEIESWRFELVESVIAESSNLDLKTAIETAKRTSEEEGVVQHVNELPGGGYTVSDWYDYETTVKSFEFGRELNESKLSEMHLNDPIAMRLRSEKDSKQRLLQKPAAKSLTADKSALIANLQRQRDRIMADMEQEAELEGGPVADMYGDKLNKIDKALAKLKGHSEWGPESNVDMPYDEIERRARSLRESADSRLKANLPLDVLDHAIRFELDKKGKSVDCTVEEYEKAFKAATKNLEKDLLFYKKAEGAAEMPTSKTDQMVKVKLKEGMKHLIRKILSEDVSTDKKQIDKLLQDMSKYKAGQEYKKALTTLIQMAEKKTGKVITTKKEALKALDYTEPTIRENVKGRAFTLNGKLK